ncbi:MAG: cysteine desulfurase [Flavobacteriales bacterium]|nr:cysteine desulfurase [Flavobacteriales bacterium]
MSVYLDNAATTPLDPKVLEAMLPFFTDHFGNPSSTHAFGRKTRTAIENARRIIARHLNAQPSEIYFTSGGTEADNFAMHTAIRDLGCKHIITSPTEHSAVLKTAQSLAERGTVGLSLVKLDEKGSVDMADLEALLSAHPHAYVTLMHANNEIGNRISLEAVGELCKKYNAIFHSDTVQTMGHYAFDVKKMHIHFLNASAHKFHGPKGVGFIYISRSVPVKPDITGGGQERGMRGGTENLYGIVGLGAALEICYHDLESHQQHVSGLKKYMMKRLQDEVPGIVFNGDSAGDNSLYTVLNVTFPPHDNSDMMLFLLDLEGVACSGGSACSSGASKGSHVLEAIGALKPHQASLRFSFSRFTTKEEIDYAVERILQVCSAPVPSH